MSQLIFNSLVIIYMIMSSANLLGQLSKLPQEMKQFKPILFTAFFLNLFFIIYAICLFF